MGLPPDGAWAPLCHRQDTGRIGCVQPGRALLQEEGRDSLRLVFEVMLPGQELARLWAISRGQKVEVAGVRKCHFTISAV